MELKEYLRWAVEEGASDIFIVSGTPLSIKKDGKLLHYGQEKLMPDTVRAIIEEIYSLAGRPMDLFLQTGDDDFSFAVGGLARFRVNTYRQRGSLASVINYRMYVRAYPGRGGRFVKVFTLISWAFFALVVVPGLLLSAWPFF